MPGPAPTVRLVRSAAKPAAGIVLWNAEPSPELEQIELLFVSWEMDRVQPPWPLSCSRRVPRCEAPGDTMSPSSVSDRSDTIRRSGLLVIYRDLLVLGHTGMQR